MDEINIILADYPGLGHIRLCGCNSIHLSIGPVTVNLSPEAFAQAAILIRNAMEQLTEIVDARQSGCDPIPRNKSNHSQCTH